MATQFHTLQVAAIEKPISKAVSITLEVPSHLKKAFSYFPGQHLILKFKLNGQEVRRSYSLNSCPQTDDALQITVKRVKGGLVSTYLNEKVKAGDTLEVMPPQGRFFAKINPQHYKSYFLFAAGSGITPIFSILQSILHTEPYSNVYLLFGNKNKSSIIFYEELESLKNQYADRLIAVHSLSEPYSDWSSIWGWQERKGRIDAASIEWFIQEHPPVSQQTEYFICGPGKMNLHVRQSLIELGVPAELIHIEHFGGEVEETANAIQAVDNAKLKVKLAGQSFQLNVPAGKRILQVLKEVKAAPPYSCESGVCGTCVAKVKAGKAEMQACMALEDADIDKGYILTCQALPVTENIEIEFE